MKMEKNVYSGNLDKPEQHKTISAQFCQVNPKFTFWHLPTTVGRNIISCSCTVSSAWKGWCCTAPLGPQGIVPLTKMCESKLRGWCCSAAPPGCLSDTGRLASKGHPAERRIYHPGKNSQFRLSSREEMGSASSACHQPRRDVLSCPGRGVPAGMCCCAALSPAPQHIWTGVSLQ